MTADALFKDIATEKEVKTKEEMKTGDCSNILNRNQMRSSCTRSGNLKRIFIILVLWEGTTRLRSMAQLRLQGIPEDRDKSPSLTQIDLVSGDFALDPMVSVGALEPRPGSGIISSPSPRIPMTPMT